jgi:hypothetical protein
MNYIWSHYFYAVSYVHWNSEFMQTWTKSNALTWINCHQISTIYLYYTSWLWIGSILWKSERTVIDNNVAESSSATIVIHTSSSSSAGTHFKRYVSYSSDSNPSAPWWIYVRTETGRHRTINVMRSQFANTLSGHDVLLTFTHANSDV